MRTFQGLVGAGSELPIDALMGACEPQSFTTEES
jgi:hypothetical protein